MVTSETRDLRARIVRGEVDPNNSSLFFADAIKASILFLNDKIKLRDKRVPHFILNTGDDILYRELMNYSYSKTEITDEDLIEKTGGIVQGMSGSPIIQDGKIIYEEKPKTGKWSMEV